MGKARLTCFTRASAEGQYHQELRVELSLQHLKMLSEGGWLELFLIQE